MRCSAIDCEKDAVWRAQEIRNRVMVRSEDGFCEEHAKQFWESYLSDGREGEGDRYKVPRAASFELELVMAEYEGFSTRVLLREVGNKRLVTFPVDFIQWYELYWAVQGSPYNEFALHVSLKQLVEHFGGTLSHVLIDRLNPAGYFEAHATILRDQEVVKLRIRPSDGLILAMLVNIPFLVAEEVLSTIAASGDMGKW